MPFLFLFLFLFFVLLLCLAGEGARPGKQVQLLEGEIKMLCVKARDIFMQQPILLELEAPIKICGERGVQSVASAWHLARFSFLVSCVSLGAMQYTV